jgi:hypothetical protein
MIDWRSSGKRIGPGTDPFKWPAGVGAALTIGTGRPSRCECISMSDNRTLAKTLSSLRQLFGIEADEKKRDPSNPAELRQFCIKLRDWVSMRRERYLDHTAFGRLVLSKESDFTPQIEVVWCLLVQIAGADSYPSFMHGPYTRDKAAAALDRVVSWCDDVTRKLLAAQKPHLESVLHPDSADPLPQEPEGKLRLRRRSRHRMTVEEANDNAMEQAKKKKKAFFGLSEREQAKRIGCSWQTWSKTDFYRRAVQEGWLSKKRAKGSTAGSRRVIGLTPTLEAAVGEGEGDEVLKQLAADESAEAKRDQWDDLPPKERQELLAEHEADNASDPSPLDPRPKKVQSYKRL